jgi:hypothetical protein
MSSFLVVWLLGSGGCITPSPTLQDYGYDSGFLATMDSDTDDGTDSDAPAATGPRVLVLDDGAAGAQVVPGLRAQGIDVVEGPSYEAWDGSNPSLDGTHVVLLLQGSTYLPRLSANADRVLRDFVSAGGGMVRTERAAASAASAGPMGIDHVLPVEFLDEVDQGEQWWVDDRDHPIAASVPARWDEPGGFSLVAVTSEAEAAAQVIISTDARVPLLTVRDDLPGRIVHVNHDLTATVETMGKEILELFGASVIWASRQ